MRIDKLTLKNFRAFSHCEMTCHEQQTVIVARNGLGKTAALDGCAIALGAFVDAFDMGNARPTQARPIQIHDARYMRHAGQAATEQEPEQQYPVVVQATLGGLPGGPMTVARELSGPKGRTTIGGAAALTDYGRQLREQVRKQQPVTLPVVSYYGAGRLWQARKNVQRNSAGSDGRTLGYEDCLSATCSLVRLQQWMQPATLALLQDQAREDPNADLLAARIDGVRRAVDTVLQAEPWQDLHYSRKLEQLAMQNAELGVLPLRSLSDGVRAMVGLVADIAWRCTKLNPHLGQGAAQKTPGIVLIDDVDLHLHPAWQQTVMGSLARAFPKLQWIVTTHSPHLLTTVSRESIRLLQADWDEEERGWSAHATTPSTQTLGVASGDTLARVMGIDPVPEVAPARDLAEFRALVEQGRDEAPHGRELWDRLLAHFGPDHPELLDCERLKRFRQFKQTVKDRTAGGGA